MERSSLTVRDDAARGARDLGGDDGGAMARAALPAGMRAVSATRVQQAGPYVTT